MSKMKLNGMGFMETQEKDVIIQKSKCIAYQINLIIIKIIQKMITYQKELMKKVVNMMITLAQLSKQATLKKSENNIF